MSEIDSVIRYSKKLEKQLEQHYGASGRGLHEKASSVADQLAPATLKSLRWVATMRNKVVHEDDFTLDDLPAFEQCCEQLLATIQPNRPTTAATARTPAPRPIVDLEEILADRPIDHPSNSKSIKQPKVRTRKNAITTESSAIQPPLTVQPKVQPKAKPKTKQPSATPRLQPSVQPTQQLSNPTSHSRATTKQKIAQPRMQNGDQPYHGQAALISVGLILALVVWIFLR